MSDCSEKVAVMMPVIRKMRTALIDLNESLGTPHNPCPLVHPDPSCVPTPTRNPAIARWVLVPENLVSKG